MAATKSPLFFVSVSPVLVSPALFVVILILAGCGAGTAPPPEPSDFQLTVSVPAGGAGTVTSTPKGISCPATCGASFPQNTQVKLTATPGSNYVFSGWTGACTGMTCTLTVTATTAVTAKFSGSLGKPLAFIFTPDALTFITSEFALLANGKLRSVNTMQPWLMAATADGLVVDLPGPDGSRWATGNLQSYAIRPNGSLHARGSPVSFPVAKHASSLASDSTYVYAVSDEGLFAFEDTTAGLTPLAPIPQSVPPPCTAAEENAGECWYNGSFTLGSTVVFLSEAATWPTAAPSYQLSAFTRSQGELTGEQLLSQSPPSVQTIAGNFAYAISNQTSGAFINLCTLAAEFACSSNVLANGQSVSDGFAQLLASPNGSLLFAFVFDGSAAPRVRVFRINSSSGLLTEVAGSPFLTGEYYFQFASLDPSGHFLLVLGASCDGSGPCSTPGQLAALRINYSTGALSLVSVVNDGQDPYTIYSAPISQ